MPHYLCVHMCFHFYYYHHFSLFCSFSTLFSSVSILLITRPVSNLGTSWYHSMLWRCLKPPAFLTVCSYEFAACSLPFENKNIFTHWSPTLFLRQCYMMLHVQLVICHSISNRCGCFFVYPFRDDWISLLDKAMCKLHQVAGYQRWSEKLTALLLTCHDQSL